MVALVSFALLAAVAVGGPCLLPALLQAWSRLPVIGARRAARRPLASSPPIERLGRDLHRLAQDYDRTEHANEPGKLTRLRATSMAYDDLLVAACTALDVPAPPRDGHALLDPIDRITLEAELARAGLSW
jgi:hypothetical protein